MTQALKSGFFFHGCLRSSKRHFIPPSSKLRHNKVYLYRNFDAQFDVRIVQSLLNKIITTQFSHAVMADLNSRQSDV